MSSTTPYFKDKDHVYFDDQFIAGADSATFSVIGEYGKDKNHVYSGGQELPGADPFTFVEVTDNGSLYGKDKNNVYLDSSVLQGADPNTFVFVAGDNGLNYEFGKDRNNVYYSNREIPGADPNTFVFLGGYYAKDKNHVYVWPAGAGGGGAASVLQEADPSSFSVIPGDNFYAEDSKNVYFYDYAIPGADPKKFTTVEPSGNGWPSCGAGCSYNAQDKSHKYFSGKLVQ